MSSYLKATSAFAKLISIFVQGHIGLVERFPMGVLWPTSFGKLGKYNEKCYFVFSFFFFSVIFFFFVYSRVT